MDATPKVPENRLSDKRVVCTKLRIPISVDTILSSTAMMMHLWKPPENDLLFLPKYAKKQHPVRR